MSAQSQHKAKYSQNRKNYLNIYFGAEVGKKLPNNSQNHPRSVNRTSVILHFRILQRLPEPNLPKIIPGRLYVGVLLYYLIYCRTDKSPVGNFGGVDCT